MEDLKTEKLGEMKNFLKNYGFFVENISEEKIFYYYNKVTLYIFNNN